jgi:DNA-directed RNA polymerase specialized sigma24 family protein
LQMLFGNAKLKDIVDEVKIQERMALTFYNLLINQSPDFDAAVTIYHALEAQGIQPDIETFINLILKAPDFQTVLTWHENMMKKGVEANSVFHSIMERKYKEAFAVQAVPSETKATAALSPATLLSLSRDTVRLSLDTRGMYSAELSKELSAQLVLNILNKLEREPIHTLPKYVRVCVKNLVVNHGLKTQSNPEIPLDSLDATVLARGDNFTSFDVLIKDEYDDLDLTHLEIIRAEIGDRDYLMLEANFRENLSYKTIAERMGLAVDIVAKHVNLARAKCLVLKKNGKIAYGTVQY